MNEHLYIMPIVKFETLYTDYVDFKYALNLHEDKAYPMSLDSLQGIVSLLTYKLIILNT